MLINIIVNGLNTEVHGGKVGAVVRALASHQCVPGSIPGPGVICGLGLLLRLYSAPRGFSPGTPVSPLLKYQHFQIPIWSPNARPRLNEFFELLGAPWVNKVHLLFFLHQKFIRCDRRGESSSEKNCCWWQTFRQPERKSSSETRW